MTETSQPNRREIENRQLAQIRELLSALIPANLFYARKLKKAGNLSGLRSLPEFRDTVPVTLRIELVLDQEAHPPYGTNLTYPLGKYVRMHQTSGISGTPMRWLDTAESWRWMEDNWIHVFEKSGVTASDGIFFPFSFGPFVAFWAAFGAANRIGSLCIPGGGLRSMTRLQIMLENEVSLLCCTPTYALHLAEVAALNKIDMSACPLRLIFVGGEPGGSILTTRQLIESRWQGARVVDHHGMTEIGPVSYECPRRPGVLHVGESHFYPEVLRPGSEEPVAEGETGELILTNLGRTGSPLLRYRTGDLVIPERQNPCLCGSYELGLVGGLLGRTDDMIVVRGINLFPSAIEKIVRGLQHIAEYRVEIRDSQSLLDMVVLIEPTADCTDPKSLARQLESTLKTRLSLRIPVRLAPSGKLPRFELKAARWVRK